MRRYFRVLTLAAGMTALPFALHAQQPGMPGAGPAHGASWFLAHTGELQLTDAQVTRLATIARRGDTRRRALRATMDSVMTSRRAAAAEGPPAPPSPQIQQQMQQRMQQQFEQERTDLRDALAVLTADQQATAWMMVSGPRGGGQPGGPRGMRDRGDRGPRDRRDRDDRDPPA